MIGIEKMQNNNSTSSTLNRFYSVQMLRGFAAILVVLCHSMKIVHDKLDQFFLQFIAGGAGVDIFFAISGFVIYITSVNDDKPAQKWTTFLLKRIIRIVPLYWFLTLLKLVILSFSPDIAQHSPVNLWHVIASFLFIPAWNAEHSTLPLIQVGWTLSFEMFFYLLFAIILALRLYPLYWLTFLLLVLSSLNIWSTDEWGAVSKLLSPILIEFIFGLWIAFFTIKGWRIPIKLAYIIIPVMLSIIIATNVLPEETCLKFRVIIWGIPGALLLLSVLSLEQHFHKYLIGLPNLIGNASYAIYLTHTFTLPVIWLVFSKLQLHGDFYNYLAVVLAVIGSVISGIIVYLWMEKPFTRYLQRVILRKKYAK